MPSTKQIHEQMDAEWDVKRGLLRFFGHFVIFAAIPSLTAQVAQELGANHIYFRLAAWLVIPAGWMFIYIYERQDYRKQRNGWRKGILDCTSKGLGWTLGVLTWLNWWA